LAFLHNDPEAFQCLESQASASAAYDPDENEKAAIRNLLASLEAEEDVKYFKAIASLNTSELINKYQAVEDKLSKLVLIAIDNVNAMINMAKLSIRGKWMPGYKASNVSKEYENMLMNLTLVTVADIFDTDATEMNDNNVQKLIFDQAGLCQAATSMIVKLILKIKRVQDEKGESASVSSMLRHVIWLQDGLQSLKEKRDKLQEQASWFNITVSFDVDIDVEHLSSLPNSLQAQFVSIKTAIDQRQKEIQDVDVDLKRAILLECMLPDGSDFMSSHSYFDRDVEIDKIGQPTREERMAYLTDLYHHLIRVQERITVLEEVYYMNTTRSAQKLALPSLDYVPQYFEIENGMQGILSEIQRLKAIEEAMQAMVEVLTPVAKENTSAVHVDLSSMNENYTMAYVLDGLHELRKVMDKLLDKTRDPLTANQSLDERKKMRERRAIPDSASFQVKIAAFFEELRSAVPGGEEEYIEDTRELEKLVHKALFGGDNKPLPRIGFLSDLPLH
jgi:hypothetical protein